MKQRLFGYLKALIINIYIDSGLRWLLRPLMRPRLRILVYHKMSPAAQAGYRVGRLVDTPRLAGPSDDPLALPGIDGDDNANPKALDRTLAWAEFSALMGRYRRHPPGRKPGT